MLTRMSRITGALLPCGAMLAITAGCSSSMSRSEHMADSRRDTPSAAERHETRDPDRGNASDFSRTSETAEPRSPMRMDSSTIVSDDRTVRAPVTTSGNDASTVDEQHDRVTMVASKEPPLSRMETPSHEPRNGEFWIAGLWRGESGDYVWQAGRIEQDRTGRLYVPGNWASAPRGWEYTPEYWR